MEIDDVFAEEVKRQYDSMYLVLSCICSRERLHSSSTYGRNESCVDVGV
jgi:hypothetical protein